jgi:hypothetical protein
MDFLKNDSFDDELLPGDLDQQSEIYDGLSLDNDDVQLNLDNKKDKQTPAPQYWQVPRESMSFREVLKRHGYRVVTNKHRSPEKPDIRIFDIYGKKTGKYIGRFMNGCDEAVVLDYDANDFDKTRDCLDLKGILELNRHPMDPSGSEAVRQLKNEIDERSDLVRRIVGGHN